MSAIRKARIKAGLSQAEVGGPINRSGMWVSLAERGKVPVSAGIERHILVTIARLAALKETLASSKAQLVEDLRLPGVGSSIR